MSKKSITILLCIALIVAFFLSYLSNGSLSYSGLKVMFGDKEVEGISKGGKALLLSLLIPVGRIISSFASILWWLLSGYGTLDAANRSGLFASDAIHPGNWRNKYR